jgi:DNA-binding NarL/FixJ family response regulator
MRVLLADDHRLTLEGVRRALESADDIEVVGVATDGSQVLPLIGRTNPDVVLLDIRMPQLDGLACLDRIKERYPALKVVAISMYSDKEHIDAALRRGACGYIVKSINPSDLPSAIRQAVEGNFYYVATPEARHEETSHAAAGLTDKQFEILKAVARGLTNEAIGKELWLSEQTVKFHLHKVYRKLGLANRTEAARWAYEHGIVEYSH